MVGQHLQACGGDHVAHGNPAAITTVKLEALHEARVGQALEPSLRGGRSPSGIKVAMQLAGEYVPDRCNQLEHLEVELVEVERAWGLDSLGPAYAVGAIQINKLAVALSGHLRERLGASTRGR